jgi:hypothetical protein
MITLIETSSIYAACIWKTDNIQEFEAGFPEYDFVVRGKTGREVLVISEPQGQSNNEFILHKGDAFLRDHEGDHSIINRYRLARHYMAITQDKPSEESGGQQENKCCAPAQIQKKAENPEWVEPVFP